MLYKLGEKGGEKSENISYFWEAAKMNFGAATTMAEAVQWRGIYVKC